MSFLWLYVCSGKVFEIETPFGITILIEKNAGLSNKFLTDHGVIGEMLQVGQHTDVVQDQVCHN